MSATQTPASSLLDLSVPMPEVDAESGDNWADVAWDAWTEAAEVNGLLGDTEAYFDDFDLYETGDGRNRSVSDGRTVAHVRVGAEWYWVEVDPSAGIRALSAR